MISSDVHYLKMTDSQKITESDLFFSKVHADKERIETMSIKLLNQVDIILSSKKEKRIDQFISLLHSSEYNECKLYSYELSCLSLFEPIILMEKSKGIPVSLLHQTSFYDLKWCYQTLIFYLRRIEFDMPFSYETEMFDYMKEKHLSDYFLYFVFTSPVITNKVKIANGLSELYKTTGNKLWCAFYQNYHKK